MVPRQELRYLWLHRAGDDVIAGGTSLGIGSMKDGSNVEITIDGIGTLANTLQIGRAHV